jgi:four helix bundle protein
VIPVLVDRSYRRAPVARAASRLAQSVYDLVAYFPDDEKSGLTATLKRAVASIPPRIADSYMKDDPAEAAAALEATIVSLRELAGYLDVAQHLRMTRLCTSGRRVGALHPPRPPMVGPEDLPAARRNIAIGGLATRQRLCISGASYPVCLTPLKSCPPARLRDRLANNGNRPFQIPEAQAPVPVPNSAGKSGRPDRNGIGGRITNRSSASARCRHGAARPSHF